MVSDDDAVERNRWIFECLYFAPPTGQRGWEMGSHRNVLAYTLKQVRNEKSLVMLKFDLEVQIEESREEDKGEVGVAGKFILDFRTSRAFSIVASTLDHDGVRQHVRELITFLSSIHPTDVQNPWYPKLDDYRKLGNMEWETDAERELASWMKEIPDFPPASNR